MAGVVFFMLLLTSLLGMVLTNEQCCPMGTFVKNGFIGIRYSNISIIHDKMFDNCAEIQGILIKKSNIQRINLRTFHNLCELKELDLSENIITQLFDQFKNLRLERLNLYNNDLKPGRDLFSTLYSLKYLNLARNDITFLNESIFKNNGELRELQLTSNYIDYLPNNIFNNQTKLEQLHLNRNRLVEIQKELFSKLTMLKKLNLGFNSISTLETGTFDNNKELEELYLHYNAIATLPQGMFKNLEKLIFISLGNNKISSIGKNVFPENLKQVFLDGNQLKYLDASFLNVSNLNTLKLHNNPWHCDCRLQAFFNVTTKFHGYVTKCDDQKSWNNLTSADFQCESEPDKTCIRDVMKFSYTINASNIFCEDDNDGIFVTNGDRYKMKVNDARLEFEYIDADEIDSEPQCLEGVLIAVEAVLLVILFIVTYLLVKQLKQRANAMSQNVSGRNMNIYTEPELPHTTVRSYTGSDYEEENILYGIELKTN